MRCSLRLFATCGLAAAALASLGPAVGADSRDRPAPAMPGPEDAPPIAGDNITFTLKKGLSRELEGQVFFEVAASTRRDRDGTLRPGTLPADDDARELRTFVRAMKWQPESGRFTYTLPSKTYAAIRNYWANKPGKYVWMPFVVDCGGGPADCAVEGKPNRFSVIAAAAEAPPEPSS